MPQDPADLKSMPLYRDVDRIYRELVAAGLDQDRELAVSELAPFDQYHYHGTEAVDAAIESLGITSEDRVLEIGAGIGGPARHIAATTGASVVALELQPDLNETAGDLSRHCGLSEQVTHVCADVLEYATDGVQFDAIVSWLAFFHIEQRENLLLRCKKWLKPSGGLFVEDLYARGEFSHQDQAELSSQLFSRYLPDRDTYISDFSSAGFSAVHTEDMSEDWRQFTQNRYTSFCADRQRHESVHGQEIVAGLDSFYGAVARLFASGHLGGIRVIARQ